ncbi:MAG TPA: hypothetical protein VGO24_06245, partial [Solirubrobacterales bacterium]|nr:hypothetical protein [Solirubrobacterales bacterium]
MLLLAADEMLGENGTASQPTIETGLPPLSRAGAVSETNTPGLSFESALTVSSGGDPHEVGIVRNGKSGAFDSTPPTVESGPRSGVWPLSAGAPHSVAVTAVASIGRL